LQVELPVPLLDRAEQCLHPAGAEPREAADGDRALDRVDRRVHHRRPRRKPPAELFVSAVRVGQVRVLRQHRRDQFV